MSFLHPVPSVGANSAVCVFSWVVLTTASILAEDRNYSDVPLSPPSSNSTKDAQAKASSPSLQFHFSNAEWPEVLNWIANHTGLSLDITDNPPGEFNYIDNGEHTIPEALDVLNGYLLPRGYVLLRRDQFLVVMKTDNAMLANLIPTVPAAHLNNYGDNELLRIVVPVESVDLEKVAGQLSAILGSHGTAAPIDASESLVLQGFGKSLREAVAVLSAAIPPPANDELEFRSFPLQHIPAADAERQIQNLFGLGENPFRAAMARRAAYSDRRDRRDDDDKNRDSAGEPVPLMQNMALNMKISALRHTNSLLVTATPAAINLVEHVLDSIDIPPAGGEAAFFSDNEPVLRVYVVDDADEEDVAVTIDAVMPGVVINEDGRHHSIHVLATPAEHREVAKLIEIIDGGGSGGSIEVIPLLRTDPITMSDILSSLFENEDRDDRPVITPGFGNTSLIIRATSGQMSEIRKTLVAFGEGTGTAALPSVSGRLRRMSMQSSRDAERMVRVVQELLRDDEQFDNPIRVIMPSDRSTRATGDGGNGVKRSRLNELPEKPLSAIDHPRNIRVGASVVDRVPVPTSILTGFVGDQKDEWTSKDTSEPQILPRVTIEVRGQDILIYSNDDIALDQVEETIRELVRQMPSRTEWTVFYLRAAPADGTAQTLVDLLRSDTYPDALIGSELEPSFVGMGSQPLRIIPDARTNALFVSGPEMQMERVERFLEFLDSTELPASLRDRIPRAIPVEFANVNDIAGMIRELYKDFMQDPNARTRERQNDRDREQDEPSRDIPAVTATSSQNPGLRPTGIQLTLAVDAQANTLLVSCNDQLFEQISQLVSQRDLAASELRPVVEVLPVDDAWMRALLLNKD